MNKVPAHAISARSYVPGFNCKVARDDGGRDTKSASAAFCGRRTNPTVTWIARSHITGQ